MILSEREQIYVEHMLECIERILVMFWSMTIWGLISKLYGWLIGETATDSTTATIQPNHRHSAPPPSFRA
jgi:hypothetical protein